MKNLPIIAKFLSILGVFGLFAVLSAVYATNQMRSIATGFERIANSSSRASLEIADASRAFVGMRGDIELMLIGGSPDVIQSASDTLHLDRSEFDAAINNAANLLPAHQADLAALEAHGDAL